MRTTPGGSLLRNQSTEEMPLGGLQKRGIALSDLLDERHLTWALNSFKPSSLRFIYIVLTYAVIYYIFPFTHIHTFINTDTPLLIQQIAKHIRSQIRRAVLAKITRAAFNYNSQIDYTSSMCDYIE